MYDLGPVRIVRRLTPLRLARSFMIPGDFGVGGGQCVAVSLKTCVFCESTEFEGERGRAAFLLLATCHQTVAFGTAALNSLFVALFLHLRWTYSSRQAATCSAKERQVPQCMFAIHVASRHKSFAQHTPQ